MHKRITRISDVKRRERVFNSYSYLRYSETITPTRCSEQVVVKVDFSGGHNLIVGIIDLSTGNYANGGVSWIIHGSFGTYRYLITIIAVRSAMLSLQLIQNE
ncbi:MAG: hypothetical protein ABSD41_08410 [Candidatus Bathyarchaeia archaeon]